MMKKILNRKFYFLVLLFFGSVSPTILQGQNCLNSVYDLESNFLGKRIVDFEFYKNCYSIKILDIEDEENSNIKFKQYKFYKGAFISFILETNWENNDLIERIIVFDRDLKYSGNVFVGQFFEYFKENVKNVFWDESFGTFYVYVSDNDSVAIELTVTNESDLLKWESDINYIPKETKVKSMIIMK